MSNEFKIFTKTTQPLMDYLLWLETEVVILRCRVNWKDIIKGNNPSFSALIIKI